MDSEIRKIYSNHVQRQKKTLSEAVISVEFEGEPVRKLTLADEYARRVLGFAGRLSTELETSIKAWIRAADWNSKEAERYLPSAITNILHEYYDLDNIDVVRDIVNAINKLVYSKLSLNSYRNSLESKTTNFLDFFKDTLNSVPEAQLFNDRAFINSMITGIDFAEGKVAVGPGEVFITLFSEAINPDEGDLALPGGELVELKYKQGRPGKSNSVRAAEDALKRMKKELPSLLNVATIDLQKKLKMLISPYFPNGESILIEPKSVNHKRFNDIITKIANDDFEKFPLASSSGSARTSIISQGQKHYDGLIQTPSEYNSLPAEIVRTIDELTSLGEGEFSKTFNQYFRYLDTKSKIQMLASFSAADNDKAIEPVIEQYVDKLPPENIVSAIQIVDYQLVDNFTYINFINPQLTQVVIGPFGQDSYASSLKTVLDNMESLKVTPNTGDGRGGFQVTPLNN